MKYSPDTIVVSDTGEQLYQQLADSITQLAIESVKIKGIFNMVLAGGSTPERLYKTLATEPCRSAIPWQFCHFYFGDERFVPHTHTDSNYRMVRQALFDRIPVPPANIHPVPTNCDTPAICAERYETEIDQVARIDLVLLGIGDDGHTASLFPETDILQEHDRKVAAVYVKKLDSWRISLTYPALNNADCVIILVKGKTKRTIVDSILNMEDSAQYPVTGVRPVNGELVWYLDRDAYP